MNISHKGLGEVVTTIETGNAAIEKGALLSLESNKAVSASAGKAFIGTAASEKTGGKIAVQLGGYMEAAYDGVPVYGNNKVSVKDSETLSVLSGSEETGVSYTEISVITIDEANKIIGFMM